MTLACDCILKSKQDYCFYHYLPINWQRQKFQTAIISLNKIGGNLIDDADSLEDLRENNNKKYLMRLWWKLTAQFQGKYYQSLIYACRDFKTQGLKTKGPFTLELEKVFVPLRVAPQSAERISAAMIQSNDRAESFTIWDFLAASNDQQPTYRSIAIIAPTGSGKTTLLEHLTLIYAKNAQRQYHPQVPKLIPILLYLRELNVREIITKDQPSLVKLIEQQKSIRKLNPPPKWFEEKLHHQQCLVRWTRRSSRRKPTLGS